MEKEQVQGKILSAHLNWILGAGKAKVPAQFQQEVPHPGEQSAMQVGFAMTLRQIEKLDRVGVFEDALRFGIHLSHRWRDFCRREHGALEEGDPELPLLLAFAPPLPERHVEVELPLLWPFALSQDDEIVRSRQLSHQW